MARPRAARRAAEAAPVAEAIVAEAAPGADGRLGAVSEDSAKRREV